MRLVWLVLALGCASPSHPVPVYDAQEAPEAPPAATPAVTQGGERAAPVTVARPFVYEVRAPDPDVPPSTLFLTLNRGLLLEEALPERHRGRLHTARALVVAVDFAADMLVRDVQRVSLMRRGSSADLYAPRVWQALTHELRDEVSLDQLRASRPMLHLSQLLNRRARERYPSAPSSMDLALFVYAGERGIARRGLSTPLEQLRAMGAAPDRELAATVSAYVERPEIVERELDGMREAYLSGDEARIAAETEDEEERALAPSLYRHLDRLTASWLRPLRRELDAGNAFVALGPNSLFGREGLFEKLRRAGYTVTRLAAR